MFDLDRPLMERIHERNLKADFVKAANALNLDLTKMSAAEINHLYSIHAGIDLHERQMAVKVAEAMKIGRTLARRMFDKTAQGAMPPGFVQQVSGQPWDEFLFAEKYMPGFAQRLHGATTPEAIRALELELHQVAPTLAKGGVLPEQIDQAMEALGAQPHVRGPMVDSIRKYQESIAQQTGVSPVVAARQAKLLRAHGQSAEAAMEALRSGRIGGRAAAEGGMLAKWGPGGLGKALAAGDWATAGRKMLPIGAVGLGLMHLMKKRQEEERERSLAMAGPMGGVVPSAGLRLPMGPASPGGPR